MRAAHGLGVVALAAACLAVAADAQPVRVVATIQPIAMLVRAVGGERTAVSVLVPPGASPHTFEPQPSDVAALAGARLVVEVGGGLDAWLRDLLDASGARAARLVVLEVPGIDPLPAADGDAAPRDAPERVDPHVWLDPLRVRDALTPALAAALTEIDPDGRGVYAARAEAFRGELAALDADVRAALAGRGRHFIGFHAAWRYFAARYALEEIAVVEEAPGEEPTPRELAALVAKARAAGVPGILIEPQLAPRIARTLAAEFGGDVVLVDPSGDPSDPARDTYPELMRWNARAFAQALAEARP